ncbi:hypothetical protein M426DRAFT_12357 [Hypoxylon sp. CI-4A]|nr:hypothetical protein M426DRAFT_12357 [Hypoxylon sp. CI-4A]
MAPNDMCGSSSPLKGLTEHFMRDMSIQEESTTRRMSQRHHAGPVPGFTHAEQEYQTFMNQQASLAQAGPSGPGLTTMSTDQLPYFKSHVGSIYSHATPQPSRSHVLANRPLNNPVTHTGLPINGPERSYHLNQNRPNVPTRLASYNPIPLAGPAVNPPVAEGAWHWRSPPPGAYRNLHPYRPIIPIKSKTDEFDDAFNSWLTGANLDAATEVKSSDVHRHQSEENTYSPKTVDSDVAAQAGSVAEAAVSTESSEKAPNTSTEISDLEMAQAAQQILNAVSTEQSERFKNSSFIALMQEVASMQKVVRDNDFVAREDKPADATVPNAPKVDKF